LNIPDRIESLRRLMDKTGVDAYIVTGSDPHGSEYPPSRWRTREWICGFTGSAGTVAVTRDQAGLWTDFRYWIQAPEELEGSGVELFREGKDGIPRIQEWISKTLPSGAKVGVDGRTVSSRTVSEWSESFDDRDIELETDLDLISEIWTDRPEMPKAAIVELDEDEAGESRSVRLGRLKQSLDSSDADTWLGISLDSVAWLLNVRGGDVPYNPVVTGFVIYSASAVTWFTDEDRITDNLNLALSEDGVVTAPYDDFFGAVESLSPKSRLLVDNQSITRAVMDRLPDHVSIKTGKDPVVLMKARKNAVEVSRISRAMEKDGLAMVRFLMGLEEAISDGKTLTELDAASMLRNHRSSIPGFLDESFSPIPAVAAHGAIIHYEANEESAFTLKAGPDLFLIDSGGQWEEGTTDITRTVTLGIPTDQQKKDYTLTLKGHIALSRAKFPKGTRGYQLDTIARLPLWENGIDYGHGTGHGVGYRLNVHEGPQRISPAAVDVALEPGMVVSNEPGIYREGAYGIRIENLLICREDISSEFAEFLAFDTLTLAPYDRQLINLELLDTEEIRWVDEYHSEVLKRLNPALEADERSWLEAQTAPLN
jgi:Xaa-Pro aminopeptidase